MKSLRKDLNQIDHQSINIVLAPRSTVLWAHGTAECCSTHRFFPEIVMLKQLWLCSLQNYNRNHRLMSYQREILSSSSRGEP